MKSWTTLKIKEDVLDYCRKTIDSEEAGSAIKKACRRTLADFERTDLVFSEKAVARCFKFIGLFKHYTGAGSGTKVQLEQWQRYIVANIVGWYIRGTKDRRFMYSYIEVARKNGKTFLASVLCLYFLIADGEDGAEVDLAANCKEQASIAFDYCSTLAKQLDETGRSLKRLRSEVKYMVKNSVLKCFAADSSKLDGFNASFGLIDEYHAAANSKVRDVIKSSQGMRKNPHLCTITTAGFNKNYPCYELRKTCISILDGKTEDDAMFAAIYAPDEGDDWREKTTWKKANPNLGVTTTERYLEAQVNGALNNFTEQVGVKTKNLNIWTDTANIWIPTEKIEKVLIPRMNKEGGILYAGVDLAATGDLTAVAYLRRTDAMTEIWVDYYLPSEALKKGRNEAQFRQWAGQGFIHITDGNVTDYDHITADITKQMKKARIARISYDSWNSTQWATDCTAMGMPLRPYSQGIGSFNKPSRDLERMILGEKIRIEYNPVTIMCFQNVVLKIDASGNIKPSKADYETKIDGVIAMIMALGGFLAEPQIIPKVYVV